MIELNSGCFVPVCALTAIDSLIDVDPSRARE